MKLFLLLFITCLSSYTFAQNPECARFRNGKFKIDDGKTEITFIERKGSSQVEFGQQSKEKVKLKVKWLSDCTYTLEAKKIKGNEEFKGLVVTVEIIEVKENSYIQRSTSNLFDHVVVSEVIKIE